MSEQLRGAFRNLAADAPTVDASAATSWATWRRARRARRRAVAAVAVGVVMLLAGGLVVGEALTGGHQTAPAGAPYDALELAIPQEIWLPSPWMSGTSDAGPLGPLALVATAPRRTSWFHAEDALFGVSAATGAYRFLDLPGLDPTSSVEPTLSPDGLHIAYYVRGQPESSSAQSTTTGYAVYDTVTGDLHVKQVPTTYGLLADTLTWAGNSSRLLACYGQYTGRSGFGRASVGHISTASLGATQQVGAEICAGTGLGPVTTLVGGSIASIDQYGRSFSVFDAHSGQLAASWLNDVTGADSGLVGSPMVSPSGDRVAVQAAPDNGTQPRLYATSKGVGMRRAHPVPTGWVVDSYGWTDEGHLLTRSWSAGVVCQDGDVDSRSGPDGPDDVPQIFAVDVATGERCLAVQLHGTAGEWLNPVFAADLLTRPFTAPVSAPPSYRDPRMLPAVGLAALIVGALGFLCWRVEMCARRRRAASSLAIDG